MMSRPYALPIDATTRQRLGVAGSSVDAGGWSSCSDVRDVERLAYALRQHVDDGPSTPHRTASAADLVAAAMVCEAQRHMLSSNVADLAWTSVDAAARRTIGADGIENLRSSFVAAFPPGAPAVPARADQLRAIVHLIDVNRAMAPVTALVEGAPRGRNDAAWTSAIVDGLRGVGVADESLPDRGDASSLWDLVTAPIVASPDSLTGQLAFVVRHWGAWLPGGTVAWQVGLDLATSLDRERWRAAPSGPPGPAPILDPGQMRHGPIDPLRKEPEGYDPEADPEPLAFTRDDAWMHGVVMVAKNVFVWMAQLATRYGVPVDTLDEIPDRAIEELADQGFDALWLIGVWERSAASATIKRLRGQPDAMASAYALFDYAVAAALGGEDAWLRFAERARRLGVRLAADMVPNHVGIDGRWVVEHPEFLLTLDHPPYPGYRYTGPNLSGDPRIEVRIEDGYWDARDAAVTFERVDTATGERRYVYHGNDGTSTPWNDTAQIDYGNPDAREAVMQAIVSVARRVPIIRFDAAMTLAKRHVRRLWFPPAGEGGAIPSRAAYGSMSREAFDAMMPEEFWRQVVDRVRLEAPGTLLLAEAFWMMEGYFVRSLGMHRVYNSAFMNMLAREANGDYLASMRNVVAFDPRILARFVNFMNNPDEEPARVQFGNGDKAFAVTTLMVTLPGMPMFGHGQVEGLSEKYGMEFGRPRTDEVPDRSTIDRHMREIAPLLRIRHDFAGTDGFRLLVAEGLGPADVDTFVYANRGPTGSCSLVAVNNSPQEVDVHVRRSVPFLDPARGHEVTESIDQALHLDRQGAWIVYRDPVRARTHLVPASSWTADGVRIRLPAYGTWVAWQIDRIVDDDGTIDAVHRAAGDRGVPDLAAARKDAARFSVWQAYDRTIDPASLDTPPLGAPGEDPAPADVRRRIDATFAAWQRLNAWWTSTDASVDDERRRFAWVVALTHSTGDLELRVADAPWIVGAGAWTGDASVEETHARVQHVVAATSVVASEALGTGLVDRVVRRWWGVHDAGGVRWLRDEGMRAWLHRRCDAAIVRGVDPTTVERFARNVEHIVLDAGYDVDRIRRICSDEGESNEAAES